VIEHKWYCAAPHSVCVCLAVCIPCRLEGPDHGPFHSDGTVNEEGTEAWLAEGNQAPYHIDERQDDAPRS
jgi:hypothetical protein